MTAEEQQRMIDSALPGLQASAAAIVGAGQEYSPILVLFTPGAVRFEPLRLGSGEALNDGLRRQLRAAQAWGYVFVAEAWTTGHVGPLVRGEVARVVDLPRDDRDEELVMLAVLRSGGYAAFQAPIEATPTGRRPAPWRSLALAGGVGRAGLVDSW